MTETKEAPSIDMEDLASNKLKEDINNPFDSNSTSTAKDNLSENVPVSSSTYDLPLVESQKDIDLVESQKDPNTQTASASKCTSTETISLSCGATKKNVKTDKVEYDENATDAESTDSNDYQRELDSGYRIITEIVRQNKTTCWPFMEAVDAEGLGLWDYHQKIKEPMWLNKIIENFEKNHYTRFAEFARDFRIMVENCYRYNTTEHPISKKAKRLEVTFEAKLALLKKDIRDGASIAKTSNGRFATLSAETNSTMRSGRVSVPSASVSREAESERQSRLVYDFVRCEESALAEDERLSNYREHKHQQNLYQQVAAAFVVALESREEAKAIKTCHLLPEIGLFLHLTETTLRLPPLAMYNLEMSLLIPSDSIYLAKIMTSFLCTYYERSLISQRPAMLFKTWENRLKQRLDKWFELVLKYNSYSYAAVKLHIAIDFYQAMNWKNPFYTEDGQHKSFLDFSYHEKAVIIKALCDNLTTFQSVQNNIASLACEQTRAMSLGFDADGNEYTYFPQFCGDDVRLYRHRRHGDFVDVDAPDPLVTLLPQKELINSTVNHPTAEAESAATPNDSSEKQSPLSVTTKEVAEEPPSGDKSNEIKTPPSPDADFEQTQIVDKKEEERMDQNTEQDEINGDVEDTNSETDLDSSMVTDTLSVDDASTATETDDQKPTFSQNASILHSKIKKITANQSKLNKFAKTDDSENCYDSSDAQWTPTKKKKKKSEDVISSPLRRSSRKRATVSYTSLLVPTDPDALASEVGDQDLKSPAKKRRKRTPRPKPKKKTPKTFEVIEPDEEYGSIDFELVCDNIESLRNLISAQETEYQNALKNKKSKTTISNVASLLERLKWLLGELSSFETHFEKARFDAKIQLKREHDELLRAATTGRAIQTNGPDVDPWEDELISKNTVLQSDGTSVYTPPASIYYEESDEESDRELRRSKRRPKRYESDEDFVLDSSDEAPRQISTFLCDDFDEDRQRLLPAALEELEARLQKQAPSLQKMMAFGRITRQNEFGEASPLLTNERRTRQRSKKENKVFRKVLLLALKEKEEFGPSLLPLLRTDQTEIGEVVERVLAQEEVARQQRKQQREEEQKRKRALKQAMQQKNKAAQASRRAAKKLINKYKTDRHESKDEEKNDATLPSKAPSTSMWSPPKKPVIPNITSGVDSRTKIVPQGKGEAVMIRLQSGKIGRAFRFPDGRIIPIMRMDDAKAITNANPPTTSSESKKIQAFHPHISLSGRRANILRRADPNKNAILPASSVAAITQTTSASTVSTAASSNHEVNSRPTTSKPTLVTTVSSPASTGVVHHSLKQSFPVYKSNIPNSAVSQRLTLPSGQVINLVVKQQTSSSAETTSPGKSIGHMFVNHLSNSLDSAKPKPRPSVASTVLTATRPTTKIVTAPSTTLALSPSKASSNHPTSLPANLTATVAPPKLVSKPLGIVSPMPVKQTNAGEANMQRPQVDQKIINQQPNATYLSVSQPSPNFSPVFSTPRYQDVRGVMHNQEPQSSMPVTSAQRLQLGMQNVALVTQPIYQQQTPHQQVQLVPALVAGSVPLVQPIQFVQTVPIQVSAPVMFVAQGQPRVQVGGSGNDPGPHQFPTSSPSKTYQPSNPTTQSM